MKRFGQHAKLKPEMVDEYVRLHAAVWPEVLEKITDCNMRNYSIFIDGTDLFCYFEYTGDDYEADCQKMADDPRTQQWWELTDPCFLYHDKKEYYLDWKEIFYLA